MKYAQLQEHLANRLQTLKRDGLYVQEHVVISPQSSVIRTTQHKSLINFASNNYLGYVDDPRLIDHASAIADQYGVGLSSVRFICGTTKPHIKLENAVSKFYEKDDTILFANGYSANMALFETFFTKEDAIILDKKAHMSLSEGANLTRAQRYYFPHNDMEELEERLKEADQNNARFKIIAFDGLSSSTGEVAKVSAICDLADKYDALVLSDECHSFGVLGENGRGAVEIENALSRVDFITGTFGKAVGGCNGGFITGNRDAIDLLRQKGRPYLFSNAMPQFIAGTCKYVLDLVRTEPERRRKLLDVVHMFREMLTQRGIKITGHKDSHLVFIVIGNENMAKIVSDKLIENGILALPSIYPYNPKDEAKIRVQLSVNHTEAQLSDCLGVIQMSLRDLGLIE